MNYYVNFLEGLGGNEFQIEWRFGTHGSWKNLWFDFSTAMGAKPLFHMKFIAT